MWAMFVGPGTDGGSCADLVAEDPVAGDRGLALGQGPCLVEHDVADLVGALQSVCTLDEDAVSGSHPRAHHHGRGGGQAQRTGAGDDQH